MVSPSACVLCVGAALSGVAVAQAQSSLDQALSLVPKDATSFVLLPNPKAASDDLEQCIERMNRPDAALAGRPIDQLKAALRISVDFDDTGPAALVQLQQEDGFAWVALVPVKDGDGFLRGNFTREPDRGEDAWRHAEGPVLFAKVLGTHVALAERAETLRALGSAGGIGSTLRERLGERGASLLARGDVVAWAGPVALSDAAKGWASQGAETPGGGPFQSEMEALATRSRELLAGVDNALLVVEFDPLGVGLRTFAKAREESELGGLLEGGADGNAEFDRLPAQPFYAIARVDVRGLGGIQALERLMRALPGAPALPQWLLGAQDHIRALQFATYPSKMGIAAGGLLNDSYLVIESDTPERVRESVRDAMLAAKGEFGGIRREPRWTADKQLKGGSVADAFEVVETPLPGATVGYQQLVSQLVFGSRGLVGFVRPVSGAVLMTFSQRVDVLERGIAASGAGSKVLSADGTIRSYRPWLIEGADVEGFLGVGQLGKLMQQVAGVVPGGGQAPLPEIPTSTEPIAFAMEIERGTIETATVLPSTVLAIFYDQAKASVVGTRDDAMPEADEPDPGEPRSR